MTDFPVTTLPAMTQAECDAAAAALYAEYLADLDAEQPDTSEFDAFVADLG